MGFPPHLIKFLFAKKLVQKTEHPAGLNKWGPLRVSNVFRPDNRVAGPWVGWAHGGVCSVCGRAQWPRGVFCVRPRSVVWSVFRARPGLLVCVVICGRVFGGCLGVVVLACSVRGFGFSCLL